jgi:hypothetical protein
MLSLGALLKFLWDSKLIMIAPGWAALALLGYVELFQFPPLRAEVTGVKDAERLDAIYAALCMNPGDPAVLDRIRDLQQEYSRLTGRRYDPPDCSLLMKLR